MANHNHRSTFTIGVVLLLAAILLLTAYVGDYYALHQQGQVMAMVGTEVHVTPCHKYRYGEGYINKLFWPAEQIHQRSDPEAWKMRVLLWPPQRR